MEDFALSPLESGSFYKQLKDVTWVVMIVIQNDSAPREVTYATGVSTGTKGLVLTCSHIFSRNKNYARANISIRRIDDNKFSDALLVYNRPKWDLAALQVSVDADDDWLPGKFATNKSIFPGEQLFHVGNPSTLVGSFLVGRAVFPCLDVDVPTRTQTCLQYTSNSLHETPKNRVMGDIWNSEYFDQNNAQKHNFEKNLDPQVPIIQISGLTCHEGCSGGPLFNKNGEIVGMIVLGALGYDIAIHVALMEYFMQEMVEGVNTKRDTKRDLTLDDKLGGSKRSK